jgi:hypothetical protein
MDHMLMWSSKKNVVKSTFKRLLDEERKFDPNIFCVKKVLRSSVYS